MSSRGRGIRARKVEAPRPRRASTQNTAPSTACDPSRDVERVVVDKLISRLEGGALSPSEASSLNLTLKHSGQALERADQAYMRGVLDSLRRALKSVPLNATTRLYLLEILELGARSWTPHSAADRYYEKKYRELNVKQRITRELGGEKSIERASLPLRSISYQPDSPATQLTNGRGDADQDDVTSKTSKLKWISSQPYLSGNGVTAFSVSLPEETFTSVVGKSDGKYLQQIQKLSDTRIITESISCDDHRKITIQGPGEKSVRKALAMLDHLASTGEVSEKSYFAVNYKKDLHREISMTSTKSDFSNMDQYETASEGEEDSLCRVARDVPCSTPMTDFLSERDALSRSIERQSSIRSSSQSSSDSQRSLHRQMSEPSSASTGKADHSRTLSTGKSPRLGINGLGPISPPITAQSNAKDSAKRSGQMGKIDMVYSIPIGEYVLNLTCTSEKILQEAMSVLSKHFLDGIASDHESELNNSSFDPNNNSAAKSVALPPSFIVNSELPPLPDSDDEVWTADDDECLLTEVQNTLNDLSLQQSKENGRTPTTDLNGALGVSAEKCRQITSTPALETGLALNSDTMGATLSVPAPSLEISSIATQQRQTPSSNVLNRGFVAEESMGSGSGRLSSLREEERRPASVGSDPSLDLEGLVRQELEGSVDTSSRMSRSSLSESRNYSRYDRYGFSQPSNIKRLPLNPLATSHEIRVADSECPGGSLGPKGRRKFFAETSRRFYERLHQTEVRGQKVLQYGQNFLLACSRSPLSRQPPSDWSRLSELPDICLKECLGFTASRVDWNMECVPAVWPH